MGVEDENKILKENRELGKYWIEISLLSR